MQLFANKTPSSDSLLLTSYIVLDLDVLGRISAMNVIITIIISLAKQLSLIHSLP
jgi:hypothetical protein